MKEKTSLVINPKFHQRKIFFEARNAQMRNHSYKSIFKTQQIPKI